MEGKYGDDDDMVEVMDDDVVFMENKHVPEKAKETTAETERPEGEGKEESAEASATGISKKRPVSTIATDGTEAEKEAALVETNGNGVSKKAKT